ncbi:MAG: hypothetical protein KC944_24325, partial [Candidatus Omnitrophica bacterium]|nr:hypothetical protein [Candidatus Omnitrophota bacterium]
MRTFKALLWKEFQTLKYVWLAGLFLFYGLGFFPAFFQSGVYASHPSQSVGGMSLSFGAVYCVILAIALLGRDFRGSLETFLRARPIPVSRILTVKYALGLFTVVMVSFVPLALALALEGTDQGGINQYKLLGHAPDFEVHILLYHPFTLSAIFSLCFLIGAWVRKAVETALLSFAAILLVYFFPVIFPPLGDFSVINLINTWEDSVGLFQTEVLQNAIPGNAFATFDHHIALPSFVLAFDNVWVGYGLSTLLISLFAVAGAFWVLEKNWSIELNQKSLAWSLAGVSLLLFGAASFEVGTNLECERMIKSPWEIGIEGIAQEGGRGILVYQTHNQDWMHLGFQRFDLNREDVLGRHIEDPWTIGSRRIRYGDISYSWDSRSPGMIHYLARDIEIFNENMPTTVTISSPAVKAIIPDASITRTVGESRTDRIRLGLQR